MNILDDLDAIKKIDQGHSLASIRQLADQCEAIWKESKGMQIPENYKSVSSIAFCGMGGSAYGARIIKSLFINSLTVPIDLVSTYHLPAYTSKNALIVAASYSGDTEETIACVEEALKRNVKIIGITAGGKLAGLLHQAKKPVLTFTPKFNPSNQPRLGQGYIEMGEMALLTHLGFLQITDNEVAVVIDKLREEKEKLDINISSDKNLAKQQALAFENKIVVIIGAEFLEGAIHAIRNPFHETSKHFADYYILPEANHHLMEGLMYPAENRKNLIFLFINSSLYSDKIKKRMELTKEVVRKNFLATTEINLHAATKLTQVFELIQLGSFVTFYLAMLHETDPAKIPWVTYFKNKLKGGK
jgi:glucose/mannose-6-phosphate isomerase